MMKRFFILLSAALLTFTISMSAQNRSTVLSVKNGIVLDSLLMNGIRVVEYVPAGVCSKLIHIEVDKDDIIQNVVYTQGCNGNTKGIGALIKGMKVSDAIEKLQGITCGNKKTSCPDQLANALKIMTVK